MNSNENIEKTLEQDDSEKFIILDNVSKFLFAPGPIFWEKLSGKKVKVAEYGTPLSTEFLSKFKKVVYINQVNQESVSELVEKIQSLKKARLTPEKINARDELIQIIVENYKSPEVNSNLLDLIVAFQMEFYELPKEIEDEILKTSNLLFKRCSIIATMNVFYALIFGYLDFKLLREIYHCSFLIDYSFCVDGLSTKDLQSLEGYRKGDQSSGIQNHVTKLKEMPGVNELVKNNYIKNLLFIHHERVNGEGGPLKLNVKELTDLESIFIFLSNSIPFENLESKLGDGCNYIQKIEDGTHSDFVSVRLKRYLESFWLQFDEDDEGGFIEIQGLS